MGQETVCGKVCMLDGKRVLRIRYFRIFLHGPNGVNARVTRPSTVF